MRNDMSRIKVHLRRYFCRRTCVWAALLVAQGCATGPQCPLAVRGSATMAGATPAVASAVPPAPSRPGPATAAVAPACLRPVLASPLRQAPAPGGTPRASGNTKASMVPASDHRDRSYIAPAAAVDEEAGEVIVTPPSPESPARLPLPEGHFPDSLPIDLATALQLTTGMNPQVAFAEQRIQEAFAQWSLSQVLWLPSLRAGMNYNKHEGQIQDVAGRMIDTSRGSVYTGMGAMAVGAGSPAVPGVAMQFHLRDAIYQPRIAEHVLGARREASRATLNDLLLQTALAYLDLLEAVQVLAIAEETEQHAAELGDITASFAETGEGLPADADRAQVELSLRRIERRRAAENLRVASSRLARLLSQDPAQMLMPQEPAAVPIELVDTDLPLPDLVAMGLSNRPELAESRFLVGEAVQRLQRERHAPLVPSILLGMSYGGNGGGLGSDIEDFGDRLDFDASAWWEIRNLGLGERSYRCLAASQVELARLRQIQVLDQVAADVAEAHAQVIERQEQIELARTAVQAAGDSYRRNLQRIRDRQGMPIESLQAIQALDQSRRQYVRAVTDYDRAQFRLQRALGWPIMGPAPAGMP